MADTRLADQNRWTRFLPRLRAAAPSADEVGNLEDPPYFNPGVRWPSGAEVWLGVVFRDRDGERTGTFGDVPEHDDDGWIGGYYPDAGVLGIDAPFDADDSGHDVDDDAVLAFVARCEARERAR